MKNKKNYFLLFIVFLFFTTGYGQSIDSLRAAAKTYPDSSKTFLLLGQKYVFNNPDSAYTYFNQALAKAENSSDFRTKGSSLKMLGIWHHIRAEYDSSISYYNKALEAYRLINEQEGVGDVLNNIGYTRSQQGDYKQALNLYHQALNIYDSLGSDFKKASSLINIGIIFQRNENYGRALEKYQEAIELTPAEGNQKNRIQALTNIATIYNKQQQYDSAITIYNTVLVAMERLNNLRGLAVIHHNRSLVYSNLKKYPEAIKEQEKSIKYNDQLNRIASKASGLENLAHLYLATGQYKQAKKHISESLELSKQAKKVELIILALRGLAEINQQAGDFKSSADNYNKYIVLKDSLDNAQRTLEIEEIQEKYQTAQRKKEIAELEIQNQQSLLGAKENANQRNVLLFILAIILIIVGFLAYLIISKQKSNKLLSQALGEKETLLKEIHHRVKNNLQVISSLLNLQAGSLDSDEAIEAVREGQNRVKSMALIHEKLYQETDLRGVDIKNYLDHLVEELFNAFGVDRDMIKSQVNTGGLKLDIDTVIPLGLIINELITNTLKYAFDKTSNGELTINIEEKEGVLSVIVKDNGMGVDQEGITSSNSFGWKMIRSLCRKLKAEVDVFNDNGTTVQLTLSRYKLVI